MGVNSNKARKMSFYFNQYASIEGFYKAMVPVKLLQYKNEGLVSRSQARRLLARVDEFKEVVFVFENIEEIGQPFADEIFRVYARNHPDIKISAKNASKVIEGMIFRVVNNVL